MLINQKTFILAFVALLLRMCVPALTSFIPMADMAWLFPTYQALSFCLLGAILIREKEFLHFYNIDKLTLIMVVLFRTVLHFSKSPPNFYGDLAYLSSWPIAIWLMLSLRNQYRSLPKIRRSVVLWSVTGFLIGILLPLIFALLFNRDRLGTSTTFGETIITAFSIFLGSISNEAIDEETLFSGLLWGVLRKTGWQDSRIWLSQAVLFWVAHYVYWRNPLSWIIIFIQGLILGFLVMKSKSISTAMITHASLNTMGVISRIALV